MRAAYFDKQKSKEMGKKKFLDFYTKLFPDLDMEKHWNDMFPKKTEAPKKSDDDILGDRPPPKSDGSKPKKK